MERGSQADECWKCLLLDAGGDLLVNNSIALLPIKVVDMFVGDVRQRPGLGSALSLVLLTIVLLEIGLTNLCKKHFEKGI